MLYLWLDIEQLAQLVQRDHTVHAAPFESAD